MARADDPRGRHIFADALLAQQPSHEQETDRPFRRRGKSQSVEIDPRSLDPDHLVPIDQTGVHECSHIVVILEEHAAMSAQRQTVEPGND